MIIGLCPAAMEMDEVKKSLWHAFHVLDRSTQVKKTRLRVLTNNLGQLLGVGQAETIWDKVDEDPIDFNTFARILNSNLLVGLTAPNNINPRIATVRADLDNLCWMLCERQYTQSINPKDAELEKTNENSSCFQLTTNDLFKLWKIFNFLCERGEDGATLFPLRMDVDEAERIVSEIRRNVGLPAQKENAEKTEKFEENSFLLDYCQLAKRVAQGMDSDESPEVISHGIAEVHSQIVSDIVRKGSLVKFGNKVTAWKDRWFVLTASALRYYVSSDEKDLKGSIVLCAECFTQGFPDKPGGKHHRFKLHTPNKQYELAAPDLRSKNEWISDIKRVVRNIGVTKESLQLTLWKERKKEREERRRRTAEEELQRCATQEQLRERDRQLEEERKQRELAEAEIEEREKLLQLERQQRLEEEEQRKIETDQLLEKKRQEIDEERQKHEEVESRLKEEREQLLTMNQEALEAEREQRAQLEERIKAEEAELAEERTQLMERLKELEETKETLEKMVEEERALKKDEETVRNVQAKILEEEFAKREELERLQVEQKKALLEEKMTRHDLEEAHRQQEEELRMKQEQLNLLIVEREQADQTLEDAVEKLRHAEEGRQILEQKLKLKEMTSSSRMAGVRSVSPNPFVTHRGPGAFTEADFVNKGQVTKERNVDVLYHGTECISIQGDSSDEPEK